MYYFANKTSNIGNLEWSHVSEIECCQCTMPLKEKCACKSSFRKNQERNNPLLTCFKDVDTRYFFLILPSLRISAPEQEFRK